MDPRDRRTALPASRGERTHVDIHDGSSGYFSKPEHDLDPRLFIEGTDRLRPDVREWATKTLMGFWRSRYIGPEHWSTIWFAGSGVSHQWAAQRDPGDLDTLIGVDMTAFRRMNNRYEWWPDADIADQMNEEFRAGLDKETAHWNGFEVTWYVNDNAADIRNINPYAAYDVTHDEWTVRPIELPDDWDTHQDFSSAYYAAARSEHEEAARIVEHYNHANMQGGPNATFWATQAAKRAKALFDKVHTERHIAFSSSGKGYRDYTNFRWQYLKRSGAIPALKELAATLEDPTAPKSAEQTLREAVRHVADY